jgi:hypothetical protein
MTLLYVHTESLWLTITRVHVTVLVIRRVERVNGEYKVRIQRRNGSHDIVVPKCLSVSPATKSEDHIQLNTSIDACMMSSGTSWR